MTDPRRWRTRASGVTLVELTVAMGIMAVIALLATQTYVAFVRDDAMRRKVTDVQGRARFALELVSRDLRAASLGAGTGRIWTTSGGNRAARPAVQVFQNIAGEGTLDLTAVVPGSAAPKAETDAVLVVEALGRVRAATKGELTSVTTGMPRKFDVTATSITEDGVTHALAVGDEILVGDYRDASWGVVAALTAGADVTVASDLVLPGAQLPRLAAGAVVRRARARLYYVDALDQLVRLDLLVPHAPTAASEIEGGEILATGVENLQIGCEMSDGMGGFAPHATALDGGHEITTESEAAFEFGTDGGPVLQADDDGATSAVQRLRTIVFNFAARSPKPLAGVAAGDATPTLDGVALGDETAPYVRRAYRLGVGVRNTSLGDM